MLTNLTTSKRLLLILFTLTFVPSLSPVLGLLAVPLKHWFPMILLDVGATLGIWGLTFLLWQQILGFRITSVLVAGDWLWLNKLHRRMGKYGALLVFAHPAFNSLYYYSQNISLISFPFDFTLNLALLLGMIAVSVLAVTWFLSAVVRKRIPYRTWKLIHFLNYMLFPFVWWHARNLGGSIPGWITALGIVWLVMIGLRLVFQLGWRRLDYEVIEVKTEATNVHSVLMKPLSSRYIVPTLGQFIYIRLKIWGEHHPFTVREYDEVNKYIVITPKAVGPFSKLMGELKRGTKVQLDGAYGVFLNPTLSSDAPLTFIAGGIGITPFWRALGEFSKAGRSVHLFYGNRSESDICFRAEFQKMTKRFDNIHIKHILSDQAVVAPTAEEDIASGRITAQMIKQSLGSEFKRNLFFICGPQPMMVDLQAQLEALGINKEQIFTEKFSI